MVDDRNVIARLTRWGVTQPGIRAMILTSSRAVAGGRVDALSDYDVIFVVDDVKPWAEQDSWQEDFGPPLVRFRDMSSDLGPATFTRLVLYEDGARIDYGIWPLAILRQIAASRVLPKDLDVGYEILLDKDGITAGLPLASYRAHIPPRPGQDEYHALIEEFFWEATCMAKNLCRDELMLAHYSLDCVMKADLLRRMLEWRVEIDHDWSLRPGVLGRGLRDLLPAGTWAEFEQTYAGPGIEENWRALYAAIDLFRKTALQVGDALGLEYPHEMDRKVVGYLMRIEDMAVMV